MGQYRVMASEGAALSGGFREMVCRTVLSHDPQNSQGKPRDVRAEKTGAKTHGFSVFSDFSGHFSQYSQEKRRIIALRRHPKRKAFSAFSDFSENGPATRADSGCIDPKFARKFSPAPRSPSSVGSHQFRRLGGSRRMRGCCNHFRHRLGKLCLDLRWQNW
jgi:hypothetical protein